MKKIPVNEIMPIIRGAHHTKVPRLHFGPRCNYATQMFYLVKGQAKAEINEMVYLLDPGDFILYGPEDFHYLSHIGTDKVVFDTVNFSWNLDVAQNFVVKNDHVLKLDVDYFSKADKKVVIEGLPEIPFKIHISGNYRLKLESLLSEIGCSFKRKDNLNNLRLTGLLMEAIHLIISIHSEPEKQQSMTWSQRFNNYLEENYTDPDLNRKKAAHDLGISESYLTALLRKQLQTNFTERLNSVRMTKAMDMLHFSNMSIKEIADAVGFANYSYFVSRFRQTFNRTPGSFKK